MPRTTGILDYAGREDFPWSRHPGFPKRAPGNSGAPNQLHKERVTPLKIKERVTPSGAKTSGHLDSH